MFTETLNDNTSKKREKTIYANTSLGKCYGTLTIQSEMPNSKYTL